MLIKLVLLLDSFFGAEYISFHLKWQILQLHNWIDWILSILWIIKNHIAQLSSALNYFYC